MTRGLHPRGRLVVRVEAPAHVAAYLERRAVVVGREPERVAQEREAALGIVAVRSRAVEAPQSMLGGYVRGIRIQLLVGARVDRELVDEALRVGEQETALDPLGLDPVRAQALGPELDRGARGHAPHDSVHHPGARAPARGAGILEEREVHPRRAVVAAVEQVIDGRVVLVDRLLDEPQAEHARVELDVRGRIAGDRGDVMDALELDGVTIAPLARARPSGHDRDVQDGSLIPRFGRARRDATLAVLEGFHPLKHALRFGAHVIEAVCRDSSELDALARRLAPDVRVQMGELAREIDPEVFDKLAPLAPTAGVMSLARRPHVDVARTRATSATSARACASPRPPTRRA